MEHFIANRTKGLSKNGSIVGVSQEPHEIAQLQKKKINERKKYTQRYINQIFDAYKIKIKI